MADKHPVYVLTTNSRKDRCGKRNADTGVPVVPGP